MLNSFDPNAFAHDAPFAAVPSPSRTAVISSAELLANRKLIHIEHRGETYSLRETRLGKLILTK